jgi:hypothetical protein
MQIPEPKKVFVIAFSLAAMAYGSWQLAPTTSAAVLGVCCSSGTDCSGSLVCCNPENSYPCDDDVSKPRYCLTGPCPPPG